MLDSIDLENGIVPIEHAGEAVLTDAEFLERTSGQWLQMTSSLP